MSLIDDLLQKVPLERFRNPPPQVAVLRFDGLIGMRGPRGLSLRRFAPAIERAFGLRNLKAVALAVNSPGGSPAQSSLLFRRIRQFAEEKDVPVVAFAEDVAASGGYWLALAADEVFAEETSLVGSIGVITASFGFVEALRKLGVQRRLYTAGENKSLLDPFLTEDPQGVERLTALQRDMHESFKDLVRMRRAAKLKAEESVLFSGEVFTGRRALELGLIDGIGDLRGVMRQRYGDTVKLRVVEPERRRFSFLSWFGLPRRPDIADIAADLLARLEERLIWGFSLPAAGRAANRHCQKDDKLDDRSFDGPRRRARCDAAAHARVHRRWHLALAGNAAHRTARRRAGAAAHAAPLSACSDAAWTGRSRSRACARDRARRGLSGPRSARRSRSGSRRRSAATRQFRRCGAYAGDRQAARRQRAGRRDRGLAKRFAACALRAVGARA